MIALSRTGFRGPDAPARESRGGGLRATRFIRSPWPNQDASVAGKQDVIDDAKIAGSHRPFEWSGRWETLGPGDLVADLSFSVIDEDLPLRRSTYTNDE